EDWPTETRYSVVKGIETNQFWDESEISQGVSPFFKEINKHIQHYPKIQAPMDQLVVSNNAIGSENPGANWLALNPMLAHELGWKLESDGLFQWIDGIGSIVARSLWWRDGNIDLHDRFSRVEVASGWLVLVSKTGFEELKHHFSIMNRGVVINRRIGWLGEKGSQTESQLSAI
ncbi:MAG: hypothetical protein OEV06_06255, partial [Anaerolineae bacterium]|nr:hypothetical protein [Anaerolineae bacterium]